MNQTSPKRIRILSRPERSAAPARIAYIQSCWHREIVNQSRKAFLKKMQANGFSRKDIDLFEVPGAFEIPLQAKLLAASGRYDAIVASGLVVNGGIYRHEFVAAAVIDALMKVQLETEVPIISAVLTPQNFHEHETHRSFFRDHFLVKGTEAAVACLATMANLTRLTAISA